MFATVFPSVDSSLDGAAHASEAVMLGFFE
jgi:hypothetical protein